jgi:hypothetical protein
MRPDPYLRIPPRPPRLPRDHLAMRPRLSDNAKAWWLLIGVIASIAAFVAWLRP